jgi:hypothetical protein
MRYLKTYESWNTKVVELNINKELKETITDIVKSECDLDEVSYIIDFSNYYAKTGHYYPAMILYFRDTRNRFFRLRNFKDTLLRIKDVCDMFGYSLDAEIPSEDESQMSFDEFLSNFEHDELFRFRLSIYKTEESISESDEFRTIPKDIQEDIIDLSWELKDEDFKIGYQWWKPISAHDEFRSDTYPYISIVKINSKVKYKEVSDFCERISNYLKSKGYKTNIQYMVSDRRNLTHFVNFFDWDSDHVESKYYKIQIIEDSINESKPFGEVDRENRFKRYNLMSDVITTVNDIFMELRDDGYDVYVNSRTRNVAVDSLEVKVNYKNISIDTLDYIQRLYDYMSSKRVFKEPEVYVSYRDNRNYITTAKPINNIDDLVKLFDEDVTIGVIKITFTIFKLDEI